MSKFSIDELIQREVDGVNSEFESARLMKEVESSEAVRERYMQMVGLVGSLESAELAAPPEALHNDINQRIARLGDAHSNRDAGLWERFSTAINETFFARPVYSFAAGVSAALILVVASVGIVGLAGDSPNQLDNLVGTIMRDNGASTLELIDSGSISAGAGTIDVQVKQTGPAGTINVSSENSGVSVSVELQQTVGQINAVINQNPHIAAVSWADEALNVAFSSRGDVTLVYSLTDSANDSRVGVRVKYGEAEESREFSLVK